MKAVTYHRYGPPDVLAVEDVAKPSPRDNELLIRIHAVSISRADCALRKGDPFIARLVTGLVKPKMSVLGTEFSGQIEAIGKSVTHFKVGDRVFAATGTGFGGDAEYVCVAEDGALAIKPANTSYEEAAAICEGMLTALPFIRDQAKLREGQTILIHGASGSVGSSAVQLAKYYGAIVTAVCGTAHTELVKSLGADSVIDYNLEDFRRSERRYDVILDTVADSSFADCKGLLEPRGIYLTTVPSLSIGIHALWTSMFGQRRAKISFTGLRSASEKRKDLVFLSSLVEGGKIRAVIDSCYAPEQAAEAHRYIERGHKQGSVLMRFASGSAT